MSVVSRGPAARPRPVAAANKGADAPVPIKMVPEILKDETGVGVVMLAVLGVGAKVVGGLFGGVARSMKRDYDAAMAKSPEEIAAWKETMAGAVAGARADAAAQAAAASANFSEAMAELRSSADAANAKLAKEAELGAAGWERTAAAITAPAPPLESASRDVVKTLTEMEKNAGKALQDVGKGLEKISNAGGLATGWGEGLIDKRDK